MGGSRESVCTQNPPARAAELSPRGGGAGLPFLLPHPALPAPACWQPSCSPRSLPAPPASSPAALGQKAPESCTLWSCTLGSCTLHPCTLQLCNPAALQPAPCISAPLHSTASPHPFHGSGGGPHSTQGTTGMKSSYQGSVLSVQTAAPCPGTRDVPQVSSPQPAHRGALAHGTEQDGAKGGKRKLAGKMFYLSNRQEG